MTTNLHYLQYDSYNVFATKINVFKFTKSKFEKFEQKIWKKFHLVLLILFKMDQFWKVRHFILTYFAKVWSFGTLGMVELYGINWSA